MDSDLELLAEVLRPGTAGRVFQIFALVSQIKSEKKKMIWRIFLSKFI